MMFFPDFPFKKDLPSFIKHTDVLEYLKQYAVHHHLHRYICIQFCTLVDKVEPVPINVSELLRQDRFIPVWTSRAQLVSWSQTYARQLLHS